MSVYRIIPESELLQRQTEWQRLVSHSSPVTIFEQPAYLLSWLNNFTKPKQRLLQGIVDRAGKLVAVLPFYWEDSQTLRLIGAVDLSDYLDVVVDHQHRAELYPIIFDWLKKFVKPDQKVLLESVPANSATLSELSTFIQKKGWKSIKTQQEVCPVIPLPSDWKSYLDSLETKSKQSFKRLLKTIGVEDEINYQCFTDADEITSHIPTFIQLHKASSTEKLQFWTPARERFFLESSTKLAANGWVKLFFLTVDGTPAASLLFFDYQNQYLLYNSGYDAYRFGHLGVGNALILHTIKDAIENGRRRFDFMRGDEPYKFQFGARSEPIFDVAITPPNL